MEPVNNVRWTLADDAWVIVRYTRNWLHYGVLVFTVLCSLIAALRGAIEG